MRSLVRKQAVAHVDRSVEQDGERKTAPTMGKHPDHHDSHQDCQDNLARNPVEAVALAEPPWNDVPARPYRANDQASAQDSPALDERIGRITGSADFLKNCADHVGGHH